MARSRGGVGCLAVVVVLLLIVCGVAVIVDRTARARAEAQLTNAIRDDLQAKGTPAAAYSVTIDGFPFLTQVAGGRFDGGVIRLSNLRAQNITLDHVDLRLSGVRIPRDVLTGKPAHDITAERIDGTSTVLVSEIARRANLPGLTLSANGTGIRATVPLRIPVIGEVPVTANVTPRLRANVLTFDVSDVQAGEFGTIPQSIVTQVTTAFGTQTPLDLPFAVRLDRVTTRGGKLIITGSAVDARLVP